MNAFEIIEKIKLEECGKYPGFYYSPVSRDFVINRDGEVINLHTGNNVAISIQNQSPGYKVFGLSVKGNHKTYLHHRVLGLTFIGRPERHFDKTFAELEINHKDGNKLNNVLSNLEWVTSSENSAHAIANGLAPQCKAVLARSLKTGIVILLPTQQLCCERFKLGNVHRLERHLKSNEYGCLSKNWYVFKYDDESPWPDLEPYEIVENSWDDIYHYWEAVNEETGQVAWFNTSSDLSLILFGKKNPSFSTTNGECRFNGWKISKKRNIPEEQKKLLPARHKPKLKTPQKVEVINVKTNEVRIFDSARSVGPELGLGQNWTFAAMKALSEKPDRQDYQGYKVRYLPS